MGEEEITLYAIYKKEIEARYKIGDGIKEIPIEKETCEIYNKEETCKINLPNIESIKAKEGRVIDGWYKDNTKVENNTQIIRENSIYEIKAYPDIPANIEINTSTLSNSIRVVTNVINIEEVKGIERYEYSIDNSEYIESNNTYTFDNLEHNTEHTIKVRVTTKGNIQTEKEITVRTLEIATPTFSEEIEGVVKITYPRECVERYTCTYIKDNGEETQITKNPEEVIFGASGTIIAKVTDGTNYITSSAYTVERTNLYVSNNGNDTNGYGTKEAPYKTINKAYDSSSLTNESTIYVMDDIFPTEPTHFDEEKNIILTSYNESNTISTINKTSDFNADKYESLNDRYMIVLKSGNLSLNNIIIDCNNIDSAVGAIILYENIAPTALTLDTGSVVQNVNISSSLGSYNSGAILLTSDNNKLIINGGKVINNTAPNTGGIQSINHSEIVINDGEISGNKAVSGGNGGAFSVGINSSIIMNGGTISNNNTSSGNGGAITLTGGSMTINGGTISENEGINGGAIFIRENGKLIFNEGTISDNHASNYGGGIFGWSGASVEIKNNASIINNKVEKNGGGIYLQDSNTKLTMLGGMISNNTVSSGNGGGIGLSGGTLKIDGNTKINDNTSYGHGGGIYLTNGANAIIENVIINNNKTLNKGTGYYSGGGIMLLVSGTLNFNNGIISNNNTQGTGGGIRVYGGEFIMNGGTINNNKSSGDGGGVEVHGGTSDVSKFTMNGGFIKNNTSSGKGGGVDVGNGTFTRKAGTICGNTPTNSYETSSTCPA